MVAGASQVVVPADPVGRKAAPQELTDVAVADVAKRPAAAMAMVVTPAMMAGQAASTVTETVEFDCLPELSPKAAVAAAFHVDGGVASS